MRRLGGGRPPSLSMYSLRALQGRRRAAAVGTAQAAPHATPGSPRREPPAVPHPEGVGGDERGGGSDAVPAWRWGLAMGKKGGGRGGDGARRAAAACRPRSSTAAACPSRPPAYRCRRPAASRGWTTRHGWRLGVDGRRHDARRPPVQDTAPPGRRHAAGDDAGGLVAPRRLQTTAAPRGEGAARTSGFRRRAPGRGAHAHTWRTLWWWTLDKSSLSGVVCVHGAMK